MARNSPAPLQATLSIGLTVLVGVAVMLNYVDRGAVSIAAPLIKDEMGLSATGYGYAVSAFFWTYVPMLLIAGWLADKISVYWLMAAGVGIWALATLLTGFTGGLVSLVIMRLAMGVGEGVAFPAASKLMARAPDARRGVANIAIAGGLAMGPLVGTLAGGAIMESFGWRPMFFIFGAVTLLWLLPWYRIRHQVDVPLPDEHLAVSATYGQVLRTPSLWAMSAIHFTGTYALYFVIAWLPLFLVKARGYSITDMVLLTSMFYAGQTLAAVMAGVLTDRAIAKGRSPSHVRRYSMIILYTIAAFGVIAIGQVQSTPALVFWLLLTSLCYGANTGFLFSVAQMLAGPASAGRWTGVQSAIGNLAGITGPVITGMIVDKAGYGPAFYLTAAIIIGGVIAFAVGVPRIEPIKWGKRG
ncbi:MFS transporter [Polymorphobacter arshaanensis]|nr:MFS transporter [Polymorphobacter arshaanensis]